MADLGRAALIVSFVLAVYAFVVGGYAAYSRQRRLADSARNALVCCFGSTLIAAAILAHELLSHNFTFQYVQQHTSRDLSAIYSLTAFWGGEEGSLLLWLLVLSGYAALAVTLNRRLLRDVVTWVVPVMGGIATFFAFMLVAVASPFVTIPRQVDGDGLVPSLQNPYMVAHPPLLYLGYVGLSVPFAFAAGALLSGHTDERWIVATRRWTLAAWTFLGFGQLLGAHWAYLEVGWGGYYSWDPVEIAALMPWLAATAFLHSVMVQERKGMLRVWNMVLVAFAFNLSLFGTFLTRSGVVNSIHSFAKSSIGAWFLGMVVVSSLFSVALILWRLPLLRARTKLESALSREATFLYNNLLFVALTLTLLWGEVFPIITQYVEGYQRTMGRPYYDFFLRIFGLPLLLLMGIGPLVAWRRASLRALLRTLRWPLGASVLAGIGLELSGGGSSKPGLIGNIFCVFAITAIVVELVRGTRATGSLFELISRNRRRYGGYIVHSAMVLFVIGVIGSSDYSTQQERQLAQGQSMTVAGYTVTFHGLRAVPTTTESGSSVTTTADLSFKGPTSGTMTTAQNDSSVLGVSRLVGIRTDWWRGEDLYTILDSFQGKPGHQTAFIIVEVEPLVNLIWVAGFIFLGGALVAMWPDAREQRKLATRLSLARVTALIVGALIALVAAVIVALPFLREPDAEDDELGAVTPESDRLLELMETRDRALAALKELEFDHRTGKIDDVDYRKLVGPLRRAAAESLQELDRLRAEAT